MQNTALWKKRSQKQHLQAFLGFYSTQVGEGQSCTCWFVSCGGWQGFREMSAICCWKGALAWA